MNGLVVFLGNPGSEYKNTRHNIAWMLAESFESRNPLSWKNQFHAQTSEFRTGTKRVLFLKPQIYMNQSGKSVIEAIQYHRIQLSDTVVIHDEIELPFGTADLKFSGGHGGHNGLRSILSQTQSPDFFRFRLGISRPRAGEVSSYVLGRFDADERCVLPTFIEKAIQLLEQCLISGFQPNHSQIRCIRLIPDPDTTALPGEKKKGDRS